MNYDLLILRKEWVFSNPSPQKYELLTCLVNKAYSKAMADYGIIQSQRIKSPESFLQCLGLSPDKECVLALLLGSAEVFTRLKEKRGYVRNFNRDIWPLSGSRDSDLPPELRNEFGPVTPESVRVQIIEPDEVLDASVLDRCLATVGLKETPSHEFTLELTAYTSFMPSGGANLLEYVVSEMLVKRNWFNAASYLLLASVIKEHNLVSYYKKCGFHEFGRPEIVVAVSGTDSPLEAGVVASSNFTVSFLQRRVQ